MPATQRPSRANTATADRRAAPSPTERRRERALPSAATPTSSARTRRWCRRGRAFSALRAPAACEIASVHLWPEAGGRSLLEVVGRVLERRLVGTGPWTENASAPASTSIVSLKSSRPGRSWPGITHVTDAWSATGRRTRTSTVAPALNQPRPGVWSISMSSVCTPSRFAALKTQGNCFCGVPPARPVNMSAFAWRWRRSPRTSTTRTQVQGDPGSSSS